jgi:N-acetylglucosamine-6-phosphate deacetylase
MTSLQGRVLTPHGFQPGELRFDAKVLELGASSSADDTNYIVPGFMDVHVHGGGGFDTMDGAAGIRGMAAFHAKHGTTGLLATTITNPWQNVIAALENAKSAMVEQSAGEQTAGAQILGVHLEGPFVSPHRLGAQPNHVLEPSPDRVQELLEFGVIRVVTIAPEQPNALEACVQFARRNVRVSIGHSVASTEQVQTALETVHHVGGSSGGTHLFNAMGGFEGRNPGIVGAILANPGTWAELILDGHHVHFSSFKAALNAKPKRLMLITDAMRAAGMPDGNYDLGGQVAQVANGTAKLENGSLAGSLLTMDQAVRNAVSAGVKLETALNLASSHPAQYLGLNNKGRLEPGCDADVVVLNQHLEVSAVFVAGVQVA